MLLALIHITVAKYFLRVIQRARLCTLSRCLDEYHLKVNGRLPALDIVALPGSQSSPLHEAVVGGTQAHLEVVELLLERGADVEARDRDGTGDLT